jgi:hypothetical protein
MAVRVSCLAVVALAALVVSCATGPSAPTVPTKAEALLMSPSPRVATIAEADGGQIELPRWITDPVTLPGGLQGQNNCTFPLGNSTAQWNFYPDGACWEHAGPDGWTRQQQHHIRVLSTSACGGGPADVSNVRVCRAGGAGQPAPSPSCLQPVTGGNGCVICVSAVVCN